MDDLSSLLNTSRIACHIDDVCINHVFSADNLCLMAPCAIALQLLQELINVCYQYNIISPMLFNLYMDDLSLKLNCSGIGGYIGTSFINHLCYADDLCLISLSSSGMQHLLNICKEYAFTHKLLYNGSKSFALCFKKNTLKVSSQSFYLDQIKIPTVDQCQLIILA